MQVGVWLYGLAVVCVLYPYVIYPAILAWRIRRAARPVERRAGGRLPSVSVVIAARNEEANVARRLAEFAERIVSEDLVGEVVVVSDGSTDETAAAARRFAATSPVPVQVVGLEQNLGKAAALTTGVNVGCHDIVVVADARQTWAPDALRRLLENFEDPEVGAVSGELILETAPGVMAAVGLYWKIEKWMRKRESILHSTVGVTGAIAAVRRSLFTPIPAGTVLDDVYWPLCVVMKGRRVVFDERAHAFDRLPEQVGAEFRRKVRTLAGNYQLAARLPRALNPWENPVWFALVSHKLMRLVVPWAILAMPVLAAWVGGPRFGTLLLLQLAGMTVGALGLIPAVAARSKLAAAGGSFLVLNAAAWLGFWVWATGRVERSWNKTTYVRSLEPHGPLALANAPIEEAAR